MQRRRLQKSPARYIHPCCRCSAHPFSVSILFVAGAISERRLLLLMGDVNHRRAHRTRKHVRKRAGRAGRAREEVCFCCCCCRLQYTDAATQARTPACLYISHFLSSSRSLLHRRYLSVCASISRRRVMTRKERGEDVYRCMLGQTLNDESSQKSNPINCTEENEREKDRDTVMGYAVPSEK